MKSDGKETSAEKVKRKKIRKRILLVLFILLNVGVIAWTALSEFAGGEDEVAKFSDIKLHWWLIVPAILMFLIAAWSEIYKYHILVQETKSAPEGAGKKEAWKIAQRTVLLGRYYDNVTPAAVGGQPFQIYYMHKMGVKNGFGAVVPLVGMITDQIGFCIIGVLAIVIGGLTNAIWNPAIVAVGWIGLLCYAFFPFIILAATFLPKTTEEIITIMIKFLHKLHIIKDEKAAIKKAVDSVKQYANGIKTVLKTKGLFARSLGLGIIYYIALTMIPFFVLRMFGAEIGWFPCFATTVAVSAAVYFIPTPGNAGAAEGTFYSVFSVLPVAGYVFWAMLFWRLFVYYAWLGVGGLTQLKMYAEDKNLFKNWGKGVDKVEDSIGNTLKKADEELREEEKERDALRREDEKKKDAERRENEKRKDAERRAIEKEKDEKRREAKEEK